MYPLFIFLNDYFINLSKNFINYINNYNLKIHMIKIDFFLIYLFKNVNFYIRDF
jgi:hypothetical protein